MKAILVNPDKSLVWSDVPDPVVGDEDVLVEIHCAALNRADLMQREGDYPPPPGCPEWMGLEISGVIVKMGKIAEEKSPYRLGDQVCALLGGGGYAEYANVKYDMLMPVPKNRTLIEAAAMPEAYATAYLNLFIEGKAKAGDTLLMNAGASGLASVVIPMAKAFGLRVITTVRSAEFVESVKKTGADIVVDTSAEDIHEVLKAQLDAGTPVDIAIDCLGGDYMGGCLQYLSHGARWIMIAALAGNWKMNMTPSSTKAFITELAPMVAGKDGCDIVLCVPFVDIAPAVEAAKGTNIKIGAENVHFAKSGAYTGEISADMLNEVGAEYVVIGHSRPAELSQFPFRSPSVYL